MVERQAAAVAVAARVRRAVVYRNHDHCRELPAFFEEVLVLNSEVAPVATPVVDAALSIDTSFAGLA